MISILNSCCWINLHIKFYHKVAVCEHGPLNKNSEAANIHTDNLMFTVSQVPIHTGARGPKNNHKLPHRARHLHTYTIKHNKLPHTQLLSVMLSVWQQVVVQ